MRKNIRLAFQAVAMACIGSLLCYIPVLATQNQIDEVQKNIQKLEEEREEGRQELEHLKEEKEYLDGQLLSLDNSLSALAAELTELARKLSQKEADIVQTQKELEEAKLEEARQYENMKRRIRFLYERGNDSLLQMMLEARSLADFISFSIYVENVYDYDRQMLTRYQMVTREIGEKEARLEQEHEELQALKEQQEGKKEEVETLLAEVKQNLEQSQKEISAAQDRLASYEKKIEEQKAYEEQLEAQKAAEDAKRLEEIRRQEEENTSAPVISNSKSDLAMLAALIECEAGGESYEGKLAVGSVVMNRVRSSHFPNSVVEVIYQSGQFSPVASGRFAIVLNRGANAECVQAASANLSGTITVNCLYFRRNTGAISGTVIGHHVFY